MSLRSTSATLPCKLGRSLNDPSGPQSPTQVSARVKPRGKKSCGVLRVLISGRSSSSGVGPDRRVSDRKRLKRAGPGCRQLEGTTARSRPRNNTFCVPAAEDGALPRKLSEPTRRRKLTAPKRGSFVSSSWSQPVRGSISFFQLLTSQPGERLVAVSSLRVFAVETLGFQAESLES